MSDWRSMFGGREWSVQGRLMLSRDRDGVRHVHRTMGSPRTVTLYLKHWGDEIRVAAKATGVPIPIILATIATENGPAKGGSVKGLMVRPLRKEPKYISDAKTPHQISIGPSHTLLSTARSAMGDPSIDRAWLQDLGNNLLAGFAALVQKDRRWGHGMDPILAPACYNSGGLYDASSPSSRFHNRWHLRSWGDHLDRFADWYGDALAVTTAEPEPITPERRPPTVTGRPVPPPRRIE